MPMYEYMCEDCQYYDNLVVKYEDREKVRECSECEGRLIRVWITPPYVSNIGREGSDGNIAAMQKSFRQRFMKKGIDEVKHKHGEAAVNESLIAGEVVRMKEDKDDN